jgi:hypothetical protein
MAANQPPPQQYAPAPQPQYAPPPQQQYAPAPPPAPAPAGGDIDVEQLKQLGELHANGILSDEEFAQAKAKVLGS